jgi:hypothetical protein
MLGKETSDILSSSPVFRSRGDVPKEHHLYLMMLPELEY